MPAAPSQNAPKTMSKRSDVESQWLTLLVICTIFVALVHSMPLLILDVLILIKYIVIHRKAKKGRW